MTNVKVISVGVSVMWVISITIPKYLYWRTDDQDARRGLQAMKALTLAGVAVTRLGAILDCDVIDDRTDEDVMMPPGKVVCEGMAVEEGDEYRTGATAREGRVGSLLGLTKDSVIG